MAIIDDSATTIAGDLLKYTIGWLVPLVVIGIIFIFINGFSWAALLFNPLAYSVGLAMIMVVLKYDLEELRDFVGLGRGPQLSAGITYSREVQEIGVLISMSDYQSALRKVDRLLRTEPKFATAYNLRGEILLAGFNKKNEARKCFITARRFAKAGDEDHELATSLEAATFES